MKHRIVRTRGQRIAYANATKIPDDRLADALRFVAAEANLDAVVVHFKRLGPRAGTLGRAYPYLPDIANLDGLYRSEWRYLIRCGDVWRNSISSDLVGVLAHEAKHIEQFREKLPPRERPANAFGAWMADRWEEAESR